MAMQQLRYSTESSVGSNNEMDAKLNDGNGIQLQIQQSRHMNQNEPMQRPKNKIRSDLMI